MTTVPTYLRWVIGAFLPFVAVVVGVVTVLANRSTTRREQALELLKWAGERAVEPKNPRANSMGTDTLDALRKGRLLSRSDKRLVWAISGAVLAPTTSSYDVDTELPIVVEVLDE